MKQILLLIILSSCLPYISAPEEKLAEEVIEDVYDAEQGQNDKY